MGVCGREISVVLMSSYQGDLPYEPFMFGFAEMINLDLPHLRLKAVMIMSAWLKAEEIKVCGLLSKHAVMKFSCQFIAWLSQKSLRAIWLSH
jgi:hypothetical protein